MLEEHNGTFSGLDSWVNSLLSPCTRESKTSRGREGQHSPDSPSPLSVVPARGGQAEQPPACTPSPTKATLQVICSRGRRGGCQKLSITP